MNRSPQIANANVPSGVSAIGLLVGLSLATAGIQSPLTEVMFSPPDAGRWYVVVPAGYLFAALSGVAGILFLKSRGMAEDLYAAMECRGFAGTYRTGRPAGIRPRDAAVLAADALLVASFVALGA